MDISARFLRRTVSGQGNRAGRRIAAVAACALAATAIAGAGSALAAGPPAIGARSVAGPAPAVAATPPPADGYQFVELGSRKDKTFNQLSGINNEGRLAGTYGSGEKGHPSQGYTISAPYGQGDIKSETFPHAVQTEVFGLNDRNVQVGEYSTQNKASGTDNGFGWYFNGKFHEVVFPTKHNASPIQDELSGVNNHDIAVGTYKNSSNRFESFTFNIKTGKYAALNLPGVPGSALVEANAINNEGDIVGLVGNEGFIRLAGRAVHRIAVPHASETIPLGINDNDTVVGAYIDSSGDLTTIQGFIWRIGGTFITGVNDQNGAGESFLIGINNEGDLAGSYFDSKGNTDGFLAFPAF